MSIARKERMCSQRYVGNYEILRVLGKGSTATVYLVRHQLLHQERAMKCISKHNIVYAEIKKEISILKNLSHPSIPIIYDVIEDSDYLYIIEEYIVGETLASYQQHHSVITQGQILSFGIQLSEFLIYIHTNQVQLLYLDFKPENILIQEKTIKIIDFGSAKQRKKMKEKTMVMGTQGFAAPELYEGRGIDERSDIYGIGMLLYYLMFGSIDFKDKPKSKGIYSKKLCSIVNTCLRHNASRRYQNARRLKRELERVQACNGRKDKIREKRNDIEVLTRNRPTIAIVGAQKRIGVTHLAWLLTSYFSKKNQTALYVECNTSGHVLLCAGMDSTLCEHDGAFQVQGISMLPYERRHQAKNEAFQVIIKDYGVISHENIEEFLNADVCIAVLGSKDWEQNFSYECIKEIRENRNKNAILFAYNFTDETQLRTISKQLKECWITRIPYEPNPFQLNNKKIIQKFVQEILPMIE